MEKLDSSCGFNFNLRCYIMAFSALIVAGGMDAVQPCVQAGAPINPKP
jgi:hypothetical protein